MLLYQPLSLNSWKGKVAGMMPSPKSCPKCCGIMEESEASLVLQGGNASKTVATSVVAYCCRACGFMEFWRA